MIKGFIQYDQLLIWAVLFIDLFKLLVDIATSILEQFIVVVIIHNIITLTVRVGVVLHPRSCSDHYPT